MNNAAKATDLIVLDFDGTVTRLPHQDDRVVNSTWARMDKRVLDLDRIIATRFNRGHFVDRKKKGLMTEGDEIAWLNLSLHAWRECGLRCEHIAEVFAENESHLRPGFVDFLRWLKQPRENRHVITAINSYGFVEIISHILDRIGVADLVDEICAMDMVFAEDGSFLGHDEASTIITSTKAVRTKELLDRYGLPPERAIGFGDSDGDAMIVPAGGTKVLFAPDQGHADHYGKHFDAVVVSPDWSGPRAWLGERCGL